MTAATRTIAAKTKQVDLNLYAEPNEITPIIGYASANRSVTVLQRTPDNKWIQLQTNDSIGWTRLHPSLIAIDSVVLMGLPIFVDTVTVVQAESPEIVPPTITPQPQASTAIELTVENSKVAQLLNEIPLVIHHAGSHTCASHHGLNNLLPHVVIGNVLGPHAGDFVLNNVHSVLFEYDGQSFNLIMGDPAARFADDQKALSLDEAVDLFAAGQIVWTGYLGQSPARGVTGCDLAVPQ